MARHRQSPTWDRELTRLKAATFTVAGLLLLGVVLVTTNDGADTVDSGPVRPTRSSAVPTTTTPPATTTTPPAATTTDVTTDAPTPPPEPVEQVPDVPTVGAPCSNPGGFSVTADLRPVVCSTSATGPTWQPML